MTDIFSIRDRAPVSRRQLLRVLSMTAAAAPFAGSTFGQGRCRDGYATPACPLSAEVATAAINPVFPTTGWKTVALDHITFAMPDYRKEAAFYAALMGWRLRSDDGTQAVLDIADWGSAIFRHAPEQRSATVQNFCFVVEPWNTRTIEAELQKRGLTAVAENGGNGFESFHVNDPDGWDLQISNGKGLVAARRHPPARKMSAAPPFAPTGWKTVWLDHLSFGVTNYKESASFYANLLGWKETYDEGSQHELMIGEIGDIIIRGGNPNDPGFGRGGGRRGRRGAGDATDAEAVGDRAAPSRADGPTPGRAAAHSARIDHISFGIAPWDTDGVKAELEKRGLRAQVDTSTRDDIHVAAFKSYHTTTPNGYNLQISYVTHENRLALANAVKPKRSSGAGWQ